MQCYTELIPPSAVTHAVSLPFCSASSTNLVVAKTSLLQVFAVKNVQRTSSYQSESNEEQSLEGEGGFARLEQKARLVLIGEYSLSGTVTSLARIKAADTRSGGEALLVSFKDAKVSLIEWDSENHRISTISIHYYEGEKVQSAPFGPALNECDSKLTVDPRSRCAALRFGVKHLAIIPFRQAGDDIVEVDFDQDESRPAKAGRKEDAQVDGFSRPTPYAASFVLPLTALDPGLTHPVDIAFLYEYREPTFGIVSANKAASQALLDERKDVLAYTVYTLDLDQRASTTLLSVTGLPYDICRVIPLPPPIGGALLVGANELIHVDQSGKTNSIAVNEFAKLASNFSLSDESHLGLRLEDCTIQSLGPASSDFLIVLNTGRIAILSIRSDGRNVSGLSIHKVNDTQGSTYAASMPSSSADLGKGRLFIGSEMADSIVLGWSQKAQQISLKRSHSQMVGEEVGVELDEEEDFEEDDDDADDDLYGGEPVKVKKTASVFTNKPSSPADYMFRLHDTLPCLGPINSVCLGKPTLVGTTKRVSTRDPPVSLLASIGRGAASTLAAFQHEIVPDVVHSSAEPAIRSMWSVKVRRPAAPGIPEATTGQQDGQVGSESNTQLDDYLITCDSVSETEHASKIYKINQDTTLTSNAPWTEVEGTEFEGEGETSNMGVLSTGTRIIQVRKTEIRTYDTGKSTHASAFLLERDVLLGHDDSLHACVVTRLSSGSSEHPMLVVQTDQIAANAISSYRILLLQLCHSDDDCD